jgi:predicted amidohydrolase
MSIQVSLTQLSFEFGNQKHNLRKVRGYVEEAANIGSDLILLPELWASGFDLSNWHDYATPIDDGVFLEVRRLAKEFSIGIGSSLLERVDDRAYNTFVLYSPQGVLLAKYRKIHRFRLLREDKYLAAGDKFCVLDTIWGRLGLAVCYDLRFPELFRKLALAGAQAILLVAEWPERRIQHWDILLRARAIENQVYVAAVNKVGESQNVQLGGHSTILDAWGQEVAFAASQEGLVTGKLDLTTVEAVREKIPVFGDRMPKLYEEW